MNQNLLNAMTKCARRAPGESVILTDDEVREVLGFYERRGAEAALRDAGRETQVSITAWANETFGPASSVARVVARANEEMAECLRAATSGAPPADVFTEIVDVVIVLQRAATLCGGDIQKGVDEKMAINRRRVWASDGSGHGYHKRAGVLVEGETAK